MVAAIPIWKECVLGRGVVKDGERGCVREFKMERESNHCSCEPGHCKVIEERRILASRTMDRNR